MARDVIVQSDVQLPGASCTENENNINLFSRLIIMNGQGGAGKSYTIDLILTTLVHEYHLDRLLH